MSEGGNLVLPKEPAETLLEKELLMRIKGRKLLLKIVEGYFARADHQLAVGSSG
jgi:hypothetical protein